MNPSSRIPSVRVSSPFFSGLVWSCLWLGAGALLLSLLLSGNSIREIDLLPWVFGIHGTASWAGGFVSARRSGRKGWYFGAVSGAVYALCILLISFLAVDAAWSLRVPMLLGLAVLCGAFGGMLGVNTGAGSSKRS